MVDDYGGYKKMFAADAFKDEEFKVEIIEGEIIRKVVSIEEIKR